MSRTGFTPLFPAIIVPAMMLALSGCNTTEALTPQVDVGHNASQSTPVTQGDLDQMAAAADRAPTGAPATATSVPAYAPQNSLQAQAQALSNGSQYGEPLRQNQTATQPPAAAQPAPAQQTASLAPASSANSIRFLPIIGAPVQAVTPLTRIIVSAEQQQDRFTDAPFRGADNLRVMAGFESGGRLSGRVRAGMRVNRPHDARLPESRGFLVGVGTTLTVRDRLQIGIDANRDLAPSYRTDIAYYESFSYSGSISYATNCTEPSHMAKLHPAGCAAPKN